MVERHVHDLLPWYVNGSLDEREMDRVTSHLAVCASCAAEVEAAVDLGRRVQPDARDERRVAELMQKQPVAYAALARRVAAPRAERRGVMVLACAALVANIGAVAWLSVPREPTYQTYEGMTAVPGPGQVVVQFAFRPDTPQSVVRIVVRDAGGVLLSRSNEQGVYRMALPSDADLAAELAALRSRPAVLWADREL